MSEPTSAEKRLIEAAKHYGDAVLKADIEQLQAENARLREALDLVVGAYNWDTPMKAQQVMRQIAREALEVQGE